MRGAANPRWEQLGISVLPKDTRTDYDRAGFELSTFQSMDDPVCLVSHSGPNSVVPKYSLGLLNSALNDRPPSQGPVRWLAKIKYSKSPGPKC